MTQYRVTYPLITTNGQRVFATSEEAEAFAAKQRARTSPYLTVHSWRRVQVQEVPEQDVPLNWPDGTRRRDET